jgi:hypothetical protein
LSAPSPAVAAEAEDCDVGGDDDDDDDDDWTVDDRCTVTELPISFRSATKRKEKDASRGWAPCNDIIVGFFYRYVDLTDPDDRRLLRGCTFCSVRQQVNSFCQEKVRSLGARASVALSVSSQKWPNADSARRRRSLPVVSGQKRINGRPVWVEMDLVPRMTEKS